MAIELTTKTPVMPIPEDRLVAYRPGEPSPDESAVVIKFADFAGPTLEVPASRVLALTDQGRILESKGGTAEIVLTIPLRTTVNFGLMGGRMSIVQIDEGSFTIDPVVGVLLNGAVSSLSLAGRFKGATLYERGLNDWVLVGALA